ncbi:MAG TPA: NAD(P)H-dependent glycerol-3-phosphate dehydrogenase [Methylococcaceae bacterium]|nr:NAD(P)H-dependent glycerol-3-phosphate dehydrogenase [Methylococcaceae bacterium]
MSAGESITVLGAGSWGTALASVVARSGHPVTLWGRNSGDMAAIARTGSHRLLPGIALPEGIRAVSDFDEAVRSAGVILIVVPSHAFPGVVENIRRVCGAVSGLAWATKGLERGKARLLHECVQEIHGRETAVAVLSGPSFAREVAQGMPTAITLASSSEKFAARLSGLLHGPRFRVYTSDDMIGVQLGGAVKNVLAIAAGVSDGLGFGANARTALITRGLTEMMRLGLALGGRRETLAGLAGLGDLVLTCTDNQSRNRRFGLGVGQGQSREAVIRDIGQEIEGIAAARDVRELARRAGVEMPISEQVYRLLYEGLSPEEAVNNLLFREQKAEALA